MPSETRSNRLDILDMFMNHPFMFSDESNPLLDVFIMISPLAGVVGLVVFWYVVKWLLICTGMAKMRTHTRSRVPIEVDAADLDARRQVQPWLTKLAAMGFTAPRVSHDRNPGDPATEKYDWRLVNLDSKSIANLRVVHLAAINKAIIRLSFHTFLADGRVIVTGESHATCEHAPSHWLLEEGRFGTVADQWLRHHARIKALEDSAMAVLPDEIDEAMNAESNATDEASVRAGLLEHDPRDPQSLRFRRSRIPLGALKGIWTTLPWIGPGRPVTRKDLAPPPDLRLMADTRTPEQLAEVDLRKFRQATASGGLGKTGKLLLLIVSLAVFAWWWKDESTWSMLGIIIGILILHEFGHWLPMKLFGYKNVTMFFIPGFGAAVSGTKHHAPAWQELIVLLGGPLPGMFAGLAMLVYGYFNRDIPDLALNAAGLAVVINAFNLIPVLPLDGGRILDLLIFRDVPTLRVVFSGISVLAVLAVSLITHGSFRYLAILMVLNLIGEVKRVGLIKEARKSAWAGQETDEDTVLRRLFTEIRTSGNNTFTSSKDWVTRTKAVLEELLRKKPGWLARLGGLALYGAACMVPLGAGAFVLGFMFFQAIFSGLDHSKRVAEFQPPPADHATVMLQDSDRLPIDHLVEETFAYWDEHEYPVNSKDFNKLAASAPDNLRKQVDQLRWEHVGSLWQSGELDADCAAFWLETGCLALESAVDSNRDPEAVRRCEILLHALRQLCPADSYQTRERCVSSQIRVLKAIARLNGKGAIPPDLQENLRGRIEPLRTAPAADLEAFLLADGWSEAEVIGATGMETTDDESAESMDDASFFRQFYQNIDNRKQTLVSDPLAYKVAGIWKQSGNAGELPAATPVKTTVAAVESHYVRNFMERRRELLWHQYAVLYTFNVDSFHRQKARLPETWRKEIPGGGVIELVHEPQPLLRLNDARDEETRRAPAWLGPQAVPQLPAIEIPLSPVSGRSGVNPPAEASKPNR